MKTMQCALAIKCLLILAAGSILSGLPGRAQEQGSQLRTALKQDVNLSEPRVPGTYYFDMATTLVSIGADGKRGDRESYHVKLKGVSRGDTAGQADQYTCKWFIYIKPDGTAVTIPALKGWTYSFKKTESGLDEKGHVFGIDQAKFRQVIDSNGKAMTPDKAYMTYNTFIDFHSFCDEFARPVAQGKGIQNLTRIGQKIVHAAANTRPAVDLGGQIKEGSYFQNGEITLALKALSIVDDAPCAVVEFDSGASSFQMVQEPMSGVRARTEGGSHYFGDIYVDLATRHPRRVNMREMVVSRTTIPTPGNGKTMTIDGVTERQTTIKALTKAEYEQD